MSTFLTSAVFVKVQYGASFTKFNSFKMIKAKLRFKFFYLTSGSRVKTMGYPHREINSYFYQHIASVIVFCSLELGNTQVIVEYDHMWSYNKLEFMLLSYMYMHV